MADCIWRGSALAFADVWTLTFGGTLEVGDKFLVTIGDKTWTWVCDTTSTTTAATNFVSEWNELSLTYYPEFREYLAADAGSGSVTLTQNTPGIPGTVSVDTTEANGSASDGQTFNATNTTPAEGPNFWSVAENWSSGTVPANGDNVYLENSSIPILYGLGQSGVTLAGFYVRRSYRGYVGLPKWTGSYYEYRTDYLEISSDLIEIWGDSGRIKINTGSNATAFNVYDSGQPIEAGVPPILWKGSHASNTLKVVRGKLGAAFYAGETASADKVRISSDGNSIGDTDVLFGAGMTYTTLIKSGGILTAENGCTTASHYGGTFRQRSGNITTLNNWSGEWIYSGSGTVTTYNGGNGSKANFSTDPTGRAITNCNLYQGATLLDPSGSVTFTNDISLKGCKLKDVVLDVGTGRTIGVS